ncbi:hypothetical protein ACLB1O_07380 [Escherichia coli]
MALLESEAASYHAPGTCTFYGTANTNQDGGGVYGDAVARLFFCSSGFSAARCFDRCRCASGYTHDR